MEKKKSTKASMEGMNTLYFLIGLNLVLVGVWILFGMQTFNTDKIEFSEAVEIDYNPGEVIILKDNLPEPPSEELPSEPLPEPIVPEEIEEVDKPIEEPIIPDIKDVPTITIPEGAITDRKPTVDIKVIGEKAADVPKFVLEPVSAMEVTEMAVYPGCEKYRSKSDLVNCFGKQLSKDILRELDRSYPDVDKDVVGVKLGFHVNTKGEIVNIEPLFGDNEFKEQAQEALERVAQRLKRKGKLIKPAKMNTGEKAILKFERNVKLQKP